MPFQPVSQRPEPAALEERVLERWRARRIFERSLERTAEGSLFRFYEGPPTANGRPGVHHVEARVFKDVFPRFQTMKGRHVPRKAGWDCHGIPVELEVEKELGFTRKGEIEAYGVEAFNRRCRESVTRYVAEFERLTERIGFWVDTDDAYWTMSREYVESVWWSLKTMFERGLIYQEDRVVPYCPRCGTALSDHEVAQGYADADDPSIYVRFPALTGRLAAEDASLLVWTTMPWTLVPATAAVVSRRIRYALARGGHAGENLVVLATERITEVLGEGATVVRDVPVDELIGVRYQAPFDFVGPGSQDDPTGDPASWRFVVEADFVKADEGTGIVHTGAAFGEDDMRVARQNGLPVVKPVDSEGRFDQRVTAYAGMFIRDADRLIIEDLRKAGLLVRAGRYRHTFPFCWRCGTPLFYYAKPSWYIATSRMRDRLIQENAAVDWRPAHIRDGRYGDWLANNVDWALSRERYWGTPLPFWRCDRCQETVAVGSVRELGERAEKDLSALDPHRPSVDEITLACPACADQGGGTMRRVPEVIDAWYDSGAMPFAQFGYPHVPGSAERFAAMFPADYICEGLDQTRGWFYSLEAIATLLFDRNSYQRSLCLGLIVDEDGRKMSKSAGNVLDPWVLIKKYGADTLRWLLLAEGSPWQSRRVGDGPLTEVLRKVVLTIWNTYYFFVTYANLDGWTPARVTAPIASRPILDRYILAELADVTAEVDVALSDFDVTRAGRRLGSFVDDLSNWYVRLSRNRFWKTEPGVTERDTGAAFDTLHRCLVTLSGLLAPFMPFLADELHENLVRSQDPDSPESVHLCDFPAVVEAHRDDRLREAMGSARRLVRLGREARAAAGIPGRQPLRRAVLLMPEEARRMVDGVREVIATELNVKVVEVGAAEESGLVTYAVKPNFRALGAAFGRRTQVVAAAIQRVEPGAAIRDLKSAGRFEIDVDGETVTITNEHVQVTEAPVAGWHVSSDGSFSVALDTEVDRELRLEGLAREVIRLLNDLRKRKGLDLADRIALRLAVELDPKDELRAALEIHRATIARSVLARTVSLDPAEGAPQSSPGQSSSDGWRETAEALELGVGRVVVGMEVVASG